MKKKQYKISISFAIVLQRKNPLKYILCLLLFSLLHGLLTLMRYETRKILGDQKQKVI